MKYYQLIKRSAIPETGVGVLLILRERIEFNTVTTGAWSDQLESVAVELVTREQARCILCVCYKPPNYDHNEWHSLFESFLQVAEKYEKIIITGDFNFPELDWNCNTSSSQSDSEISLVTFSLTS